MLLRSVTNQSRTIGPGGEPDVARRKPCVNFPHDGPKPDHARQPTRANSGGSSACPEQMGWPSARKWPKQWGCAGWSRTCRLSVDRSPTPPRTVPSAADLSNGLRGTALAPIAVGPERSHRPALVYSCVDDPDCSRMVRCRVSCGFHRVAHDPGGRPAPEYGRYVPEPSVPAAPLDSREARVPARPGREAHHA